MKELQKIVSDFVDDRPTLKENNTLERVFFLLSQEMDEVGEDLHNGETIGSELADLIFFILTLANIHGIDMEAEFREKTAWNHIRYQAHLFQDGDYEDARKEAKENERKYKNEFYD